MINFKKIEIKDKSWMQPLITAGNLPGCHQNFTNIFAWGEVYDYHVARVGDRLVVKGYLENVGYYYLYPTGSGDIKPVIEAMLQDAADNGHDFRLFGLTPDNIAVLDSLFPGRFTYQAIRDSFDYVYLLDKLVTLSGNKLHAKRNHINKFKQNNSWSFELISKDNLDECWEMNIEWCKEHDCNDDDLLKKEKCAVRRCFDNYFELGLEGGLLRLDGKVIAFTMGDKLNSDTYDIHIEKAFGKIQGAYQMINREFAAYIQETHPEIVYVNREEDMGYEGLRKAKLSYQPVRLEEKYAAWQK
ncbi:MAG TPA: DUF2156 domain-containing protein [Peptococcaceae bacterium]|nr:DUF2156 domain-containing protein [Peptococcaceae bacterium]